MCRLRNSKGTCRDICKSRRTTHSHTTHDFQPLFFMGKKASDYFHAWGGLNCAQAVSKAFQKEFNIPEELIRSYKDKGSGQAPEGACGSFFAARQLLKEPQDIVYLAKKFEELAGSTRCKEVRRLKKVSCKETVDIAADILADILK